MIGVNICSQQTIISTYVIGVSGEDNPFWFNCRIYFQKSCCPNFSSFVSYTFDCIMLLSILFIYPHISDLRTMWSFDRFFGFVEKNKGSIKNGRSRETGYTRHRTKTDKAKNTTQKTKKVSNEEHTTNRR